MEFQQSKSGFIYLIPLNGGVVWEELLTQVGGFAETRGLAKQGFVLALVERERSYPTGINAQIGAAIPHTDRSYTNKASLVIAVLDKPVYFQLMGTANEEIPVEVLFMPLMGDSKKQLNILGAIADFIQAEGKIKTLKDKNAITLLSDSFDPVFKL